MMMMAIMMINDNDCDDNDMDDETSCDDNIADDTNDEDNENNVHEVTRGELFFTYGRLEVIEDYIHTTFNSLDHTVTR